MPLGPGTTFAGYRIIGLLGAGGMGEVYLAEHTRLPRQDALKIVPADASADAAFRQRFLREADLAAGLRHPNIVSVHDSGEFEGQLWISMDYVEGTNAEQLLAGRYPAGMPPAKVATIVTAVAGALDYVHEQGLLHRDVKPSNIMLTSIDDAGRQRILLADFGIARIADEQSTGDELDGRSDQYGLAATAYQLLTGSQMFQHSKAAAVISRHLTSSPPALADERPGLGVLDPVLAVALAKDPNDRFPRCADFARALAEKTTSSGIASPSAATRTVPAVPAAVAPAASPESRTTGRLSKRASAVARRVPLRWVGVAALSVVAMLVIGAIVWTGVRPTHHAKPTAPPKPSSIAAAPPAPPACADPTAVPVTMTSRDKLAQLLMVGVKNADDARAVVSGYRVGGIFIGSWTDLSMLTNGALRQITEAAGPLPLAVSVDEEGGRVARLKSLIGTAPSPRVLGQTARTQQVHDLALQRGQAMKKLGITIDFAPVVDVTDASDGTVIGDRSFSSDPDKVTVYAGAYAQGLRDAGLLPVLKHFPGHGHGSGDSHKTGVSTPPLSQLQTNDLVPYRKLVTETPVAVMVGHLDVPELTDNDPASLSPAAVQLLRTGTGYAGPPFNGPIFTDDLSSMAAISDRYGVAEAVLRALRAGADIALWVTTDQVPAVLDRLEKALAAGELKMSDVDASLMRVATMKGQNPKCEH